MERLKAFHYSSSHSQNVEHPVVGVGVHSHCFFDVICHCSKPVLESRPELEPISYNCHGDAAVRHGAHHPIEHVQGFTGSHWMPPSGKCLRRIALAAAIVNKFVETTQNTNKTQLLASNYGTFWAQVIRENFIPQNGPSTLVIDATSFLQMWNTTIGAEELVVISIYHTFSADKK